MGRGNHAIWKKMNNVKLGFNLNSLKRIILTFKSDQQKRQINVINELKTCVVPHKSHWTQHLWQVRYRTPACMLRVRITFDADHRHQHQHDLNQTVLAVPFWARSGVPAREPHKTVRCKESDSPHVRLGPRVSPALLYRRRRRGTAPLSCGAPRPHTRQRF